MTRHCERSWSRQCVLLLALLLAACRPRTVSPTATLTSLPPTVTPTVILAPPTPTPVVYVIQPGDSLSAIADRFGISVEMLSQANGISDPNVIQVGQKLVIPGPTAIPVATVAPTPTPTPNVPPQLEIVDVIGRGAPTAETVILANRGRGVALQNWTLRDGQGNVFVFPNLYLATGAEVRIHTGKGENSPQHLYWNRDTAVWGESGDTAILADDRGVIYASRPLG
jgi:LysM repeat protein